MAREDIIIMRQKELKRLSIIQKVIDKEITQVEASNILELSNRQIKRIVKRVKEEGERGVIHRSRGRPSVRAIAKEIKEEVLELCRTKYSGFNPTFATEKLLEIEKIDISRETLRIWFIEENIPYRRRKARPHRQWRERKQYFGEMIQMDGSHHKWFGERGPACVLMGYIDDATGNVFARFYSYEGTIPALDSFKCYSKKYGLPVSVYIDKHKTYKSDKEPTIEEQLRNEEPLTQFGRVLDELGVRVIYANSPQAKGRIERLFRTFQDRLIKEMQLRGISTIKEANRFLVNYLPKYNKRFSVVPAKDTNLHRLIPEGIRLDKIFCIRTERSLRNDFTVAHDKKLYQVMERVNVKKVIVEERVNGRLYITYKGNQLKYKVIGQRPLKEKPRRLNRPKRVWVPPMSHPWKRQSYKRMVAC